MMNNLMIQMMLKKVFALFSQTKLIWLALLMFGTTAHAGVTVRYQHTDSLGSVIMETNASGQMIGSRHQYQPFGQGLNGQKTGLGYTGHLEDTDLGLTYMQQRYYDPVIGRFYSNDPVGFTASNPMMFNRYAYANNNPYKYVDPDGELPVLVPIVLFVLKEAAAEVASQATGGATDFLSVRRMATNGVKGIIYKRTNPITGNCYVGKCKSMDRYKERQKEHDKKVGVQHDYDVLEEVDGDSSDLSFAEESHLREQGGLKKEGGTLENKIHAMSDKKFRAASMVRGVVVRVSGRIESNNLKKQK